MMTQEDAAYVVEEYLKRNAKTTLKGLEIGHVISEKIENGTLTKWCQEFVAEEFSYHQFYALREQNICVNAIANLTKEALAYKHKKETEEKRKAQKQKPNDNNNKQEERRFFVISNEAARAHTGTVAYDLDEEFAR